MEALRRIQAELKAPKGQFNKFGNYKYRSCEDILEAVKPLLAKENATLVLSDAVEHIGERFYIRSQALFKDSEGKEAKVYAYAREPEDKKGMDGSQITGTASSYARKYALNGLFLIDDTKDADTDEYKKESEARVNKTTRPLKEVQNELKELCKVKKLDFSKICIEFKVTAKSTVKQLEQVIEEVKGR